MRGGLHFIRYLETGHYHGIDINRSLIDAARHEITQAGLHDKQPSLLVDGHFGFDEFGSQFDFAVSISVFTHLPMNNQTVITNAGDLDHKKKSDMLQLSGNALNHMSQREIHAKPRRTQ